MIDNIIFSVKNCISNLSLPMIRGEVFLFLLFVLFAGLYNVFKSKKIKLRFGRNFIIGFELLFEKIYDFFAEILGDNQKKWVKSFIVCMFFVILFSNLTGSLIDFLNTMFPGIDEFIAIPTADSNFNIAMALIAVFIILLLQYRSLGLGQFLYSYFPIFGKDIIKIERGNMNKFVYYILFVFVKAFDIVISMFVGILDVIGNIAKVISLSFRLTGNMMSGTILLGMAVAGMSALTSMISGVELPIILPLLIVLQGLLVAVIQAFVFSLLTAIFIKVVTE